MGWFSSACSWVGSAVSSVASGIGRAASAAFSTAKNIAGKAVGWIADKAEGIVGAVKGVWAVVKPYVTQIRGALKAAALVVAPAMPWLSTALLALEKGLGALTAFENSPIAKKINAAINWAIALAKKWQGNKNKKENEQEEMLSDEELDKARQHQEDLRMAEREVSEEERLNLELASAINDYAIAKKDLDAAIKAGPENFEHYLRLRATQKLLTISDKKFREAKTIDDLSADDLFLVRVASDLIKSNPELSNAAAERLDRTLLQKYGKKLTPFIYEEMIASWEMKRQKIHSEWAESNRQQAKEAMLLKRLELAKKLEGDLPIEEQQELERLEKSVPAAKAELDELAVEERDIQRYIGAAEGFLQILEKTEEEIIAEDREYLIENSETVGRLLIDFSENGREFSSLTDDEQSLINDYSNIFHQEATSRMEKILEVEA